MKTSDVVKRYTCLSVSLFVNALGIALITHANLGTTPITTLPYTLAAIFGLTLGTTTFACNLIFLLLQRILLRRRLGIAELLQIPAVLIFSVFIDIWMHLTGALVTDVYVWQIVMCVVGSAVLGAGISLEIMSNATVIPGEGLVIVISTLSRKNFGNIRSCSTARWSWPRSSSALPCWAASWACAKAPCSRPSWWACSPASPRPGRAG